MNSEDILKRTYNGLETFLQHNLNAEDYQQFQLQKQQRYPTWYNLWDTIRDWLYEYNLEDMNESLWSLAQILTQTCRFQYQLKNSFCLHEDFWNQVYRNLVTAKSRLPC